MTHSRNDDDAPASGTTVREDTKDGQVIALESYRPIPGCDGDTPEDMAAYAMRELEPFIELARAGKIRAIVVAAELIDTRASITYPMGSWEPGLIAATELVRSRLLQQG